MIKNLNNNEEEEEKEISLLNMNQIKSNKSNNSLNNEVKTKFKSNKSLKNPILSLKNSEKSSEKNDNEDEHMKFERKKAKFHTLKVRKTDFNVERLTKKRRLKGTRARTKKKSGRKLKKELTLKKKETIIQEEEKKVESEEFEDKEEKTKLELILENKFAPTETMLCYCKCQLFISYDNRSEFEFTGLEGILCVVINRVYSNLYLQIYDIMDFKKQFEIELYTNISLNKGYEVLSEKFHTIEFPTFCIGINFSTKKKAEEIKNIILNYSKALNSSLFYTYETKNHDSFLQKKIFDYILYPKKLMNESGNKKKVSNDINTKPVNNNIKINENNKIINDIKNINNYYLDRIFEVKNKKSEYKITLNEQMLAFGVDTESNEVIFDTSKGANRFLEQNNIEISIINEECEKMKEKIKIKIKNNKIEKKKTRKNFQDELKDKENKEKIADIIKQMEGLQNKVSNIFDLEDEEKQKLNNKIKKFNIATRLPINQKLVINSAPDNMVFFEDDSEGSEDEEGEEMEDEEGEEIEDDKEDVMEETNNNIDNNKIINNFILDKNNSKNIKENNNIKINNNNKINNMFLIKRFSSIKKNPRNSSLNSNKSINDIANNIKINNNVEKQEKIESISNEEDKSSMSDE